MPSSSNNINNKSEDDLQTKSFSAPWFSSTWPTRQKPRWQLILQLGSNTLLFFILETKTRSWVLLQLVFPFPEPKATKILKETPSIPEKPDYLHWDCSTPLGLAPSSSTQLGSVPAGQQWDRDTDEVLVMETFLRKKGDKMIHLWCSATFLFPWAHAPSNAVGGIEQQFSHSHMVLGHILFCHVSLSCLFPFRGDHVPVKHLLRQTEFASDAQHRYSFLFHPYFSPLVQFLVLVTWVSWVGWKYDYFTVGIRTVTYFP